MRPSSSRLWFCIGISQRSLSPYWHTLCVSAPYGRVSTTIRADGFELEPR